MGEIIYHPTNGISENYFPYENQEGYLSPAIFVEFTNPKRKKTLATFNFGGFYICKYFRRGYDRYWVQSLGWEYQAWSYGEEGAGSFWGNQRDKTILKQTFDAFTKYLWFIKRKIFFWQDNEIVLKQIEQNIASDNKLSIFQLMID